MIRIISFVLLTIISTKNLTAQQVIAEKKSIKNSSSLTPVKKNVVFSSKKETPTNSSPATTITTQNTNKNFVNSEEAEKQIKALKSIETDYRFMPANVQLKISANKAQGKYLLEGIAKAFTVEIKECLTDADQKKTFSFLKSRKEFISSQLVSAGIIKIIIEPTFDSGELKEAMAAQSIHANFLSRMYLLKTHL